MIHEFTKAIKDQHSVRETTQAKQLESTDKLAKSMSELATQIKNSLEEAKRRRSEKAMRATRLNLADPVQPKLKKQFKPPK